MRGFIMTIKEKHIVTFGATYEEFQFLTDLKNFIDTYDNNYEYDLRAIINNFNEYYELSFDSTD